tara:strand:+ start:2210 stop:2710 length:501 start_codon:yes stop_codon:yes gene_type:complete
MNIRVTFLLVTSLMLLSCGEIKKQKTVEIKINEEIKVLNAGAEHVILRNISILCSYSDYEESNINSETSDGHSVLTSSSSLYYNRNNLDLFKSWYKKNRIKESFEIFDLLDSIEPNWLKVDVYQSESSSIDNLEKYDSYSYKSMQLTKDSIFCYTAKKKVKEKADP